MMTGLQSDKNKSRLARDGERRVIMQNSLVCNDIIPQNDPRVQEVIKRLNLSNNFNLEVIGVQNMQQLEGLTQLLEKLTPNVLDNFKDRIEQFKQKAELFNEQVKSMLALSTLKITTTVTNIYKRIVSCSRTIRSNNRSSSFSKSNQGDSGDSDQPEPPSPPGLAYLFAYPRLITHTQKKNRYSFSWQSAPNGCSMSGGGRA